MTKTIQKRLDDLADSGRLSPEMTQRVNLYTTALIMLDRYRVEPKDFWGDVERLRREYNFKYYGKSSLRNETDRERLVLEREKKIVCCILEHYINQKEMKI